MKPIILSMSIFCLALSNAVGNATSKEEFTLARAPQMSSARLMRAWLPFLKQIKADTGITIKLKLFANRTEFEEFLYNKQPDFAFLNPYYATLAKQKHNYRPLVRDNSKKLTAIIITGKNSAITHIGQLQSKQLAFPAQNAFGASLYPRAMLIEKNKINISAVYLGSHGNVYRTVAQGKYIAGGGVMGTLTREPQALQNRLRIIYKAPIIARHPLIAHPRIPSSIRERLISAILQMRRSESGKQLLKAVRINHPIRANYKRDYLALEKLNINKYTRNLNKDLGEN